MLLLLGTAAARPAYAASDELEAGRDSSLYVPPNVRPGGAPLIVALHGAGGSGNRFLERFVTHANRTGTVVLAPDSRARTWDIDNAIGDDARYLNGALNYVFAKHVIDRRHVCVAGYSDGATYALNVGLTNGELFTHVIAFSAGYLNVREPTPEKPRIFLSHGTRDEILPIDRCGRVIAASLRRMRYQLTWREFDGTHALPPEIVAEALRWFLR